MLKWLKFSGFCLLITLFFGLTASIALAPLSSYQRRRLTLRTTGLICWLMLRNFGTHVKVQNRHFLKGAPFFIVCNHLSYLDVLFLFPLIPCVFVTSQEVRRTPFLGWICRLAGCAFVERRNRSTLKQETDSLASLLHQGFSIALFPEGTSSNGARVLPFKSTFLQPALETDAQVLPICINYRRINNQRVSVTERDNLFWYGEMSFLPHFLRFLSMRKLEVDITILKPIAASHCVDRKDLTAKAFGKISEAYEPVRESGVDEEISRTHTPEATC